MALVCIIGVDGSGKSTVARAAVDMMLNRGVDAAYTWSRWEPWLMRPFVRMLRGASRTKRNAGGEARSLDSEAHRSRKQALLRNRLVRSTWLRLAALDYRLTARTSIREAVASHQLVLCDRYVFDFVVDQTLNMGGDAASGAELLGLGALRSFPEPDAVVLIDVPARVAFSRKDDGIGVPELERRVAMYRDLAEQIGAHIVDAQVGIEDVAAQISLVCQGVLEGDVHI